MSVIQVSINIPIFLVSYYAFFEEQAKIIIARSNLTMVTSSLVQVHEIHL